MPRSKNVTKSAAMVNHPASSHGRWSSNPIPKPVCTMVMRVPLSSSSMVMTISVPRQGSDALRQCNRDSGVTSIGSAAPSMAGIHHWPSAAGESMSDAGAAATNSSQAFGRGVDTTNVTSNPSSVTRPRSAAG